MKIRSTVIVKGRVQGVSFRHYTTRTAQQHNLTGWVMNLPDGSVQACFEGEEAEVNEMVDWCRRGPSQAQVYELIEQKGEYTGEYSNFEVRYSYE